MNPIYYCILCFLEWNQTKTILFFTPFFDEFDYNFGFGQKPFFDHKCPVTNCLTTDNRELLGKVLTWPID